MNFSQKIINWYNTNKRSLPWRETRNPYKIWLSEIILQQTKVAQGLPYYCKIIAIFPTIKDLAKATEDEVLKLWQGLGYYSRARNLHSAAKEICENYNGIFPNSYKDIIKLKPQKIVYCSCNPSTQVRDIINFCNNGYKLKKVRPIDMFPNTPHIECVSTLECIE